MTTKTATKESSTALATTAPAGAIAALDDFATPEFNDPNAKKPRIQALRGEDPSQFGYFISTSELAACEWLDFSLIEDKVINYTFSSGDQEDGVLLKKPRLLVVQTSPLFAENRQASKDEQRMVAEPYDRNKHKGNSAYVNVTAYDVLLLNSKNQPLHDVPLQYMSKGANSATFSEEWAKFLEDVAGCHAAANKIPKRKKNAVFNSLCVFCPVLAREMAGSATKSPALMVKGYDRPTKDNWTSYFIGTAGKDIYQPILDRFTFADLQIPVTHSAELVDEGQF
jgi:hypothetical protein